MWLRRIDIPDFGIFRHARLNDLSPGLNVIAGPQRAGKTTFMDALRHIGYGIPKGEDLPPPTDEYEIEVELVHNDATYLLSLEGYGGPNLVPKGDSPELDLSEIYGQVSPFRYRQLFTITLDELKRVPPGLDTDEQKTLTAVLLGAGWADAVRIPELSAEVEGEYTDLGGVHGTHYRMGDHLDQIEEGLEAKDEAEQQVEEFREVTGDLRKTEWKIRGAEEKIAELEEEKTRLRAAQQHLEDLRRYDQLGARIHESDVSDAAEALPEDVLDRVETQRSNYRDAVDEVEEQKDRVKARVGEVDLNDWRTPLLEHRETLARYDREVSGWRTQLENVESTETDLTRQRETLQSRVADIRSGWADDLDLLKEVPTDLFARDHVREVVTTYNDAKAEAQSNRKERERKSNEVERLEQQADQVPEAGEASPQRAAWLLVISSALGVGLGVGVGVFLHPLVGLLLAVLVLAGASVVLVPRLRGSGDVPTSATYQHQIREAESRIDVLEEEAETLEEELTDAQESVAELRDELNLPEDLSADAIGEFYKEVQDLQEDLEELEHREQESDEARQTLAAELQEVASIVQEVEEFPWNPDDPLKHGEDLCDAVERAAEQAALAEDLEEALAGKRRVEDKINGMLDAVDAIPSLEDPPRSPADVRERLAELADLAKEVEELRSNRRERQDLEEDLLSGLQVDSVLDAFEGYREPENDDPWVLAAVRRYGEAFATVEEVRDELEEVESGVEALDEERTELQEKKGELKTRRDDLATDEALMEAHQTIEKARQTLEPMAERWATRRVAEYLLDELHDRFVEKAAGPLIEEASDVFRRITGEDYTEVEPTEIEEVQFEARQADGDVQDTAELSRATREQLFLAVRLARIQQIEPPLPVIIDDSTTNFDPAHQHRVVEILGELAETHQVLLLTCHPEIVETVSNQAGAGNYWTLDEGRFDGPFQDAIEVGAFLEDG